MSEKPENPSAFPGLHPSRDCRYQDAGMTLRDYFAVKAMQGILASQPCQVSWQDEEGNTVASCTARDAYTVADAMLVARGKHD